jgi:hypothetical protein
VRGCGPKTAPIFRAGPKNRYGQFAVANCRRLILRGVFPSAAWENPENRRHGLPSGSPHGYKAMGFACAGTANMTEKK